MALAVGAYGLCRVPFDQGCEIYKLFLSNELCGMLVVDKVCDTRLGGQMYRSMDYNIYTR